MQKVDSYYLYEVGAALQQIDDLKFNWNDNDTRGSSYQEAFVVMKNAKDALDKLLRNETYRLKTCIQKGRELSETIQSLIEKIDNDPEKNKLLSFHDMWPVREALDGFEAVLSSELALLDLYVITKKGGYDISELMTNGQVCFPRELTLKVPECIGDIRAGTKCIAVSLPTAAGFHLHRANEAVLHRYWDSVTGNHTRPSTGNMGDYLNQLEQKNAGDANVRSALKDLKNLHRNPLIHPEHTLESVEEAIALMDHIKAVIFHMLKAIPEQKPKAQEKPNLGGLVAAHTPTADRLSLKEANSDETLDEESSSKSG